MFNLKMIKTNKKIINWGVWLILVILWNFCYPEAKPIYDVLVAIILSLTFILIKKINEQHVRQLTRQKQTLF